MARFGSVKRAPRLRLSGLRCRAGQRGTRTFWERIVFSATEQELRGKKKACQAKTAATKTPPTPTPTTKKMKQRECCRLCRSTAMPFFTNARVAAPRRYLSRDNEEIKPIRTFRRGRTCFKRSASRLSFQAEMKNDFPITFSPFYLSQIRNYLPFSPPFFLYPLSLAKRGGTGTWATGGPQTT